MRAIWRLGLAVALGAGVVSGPSHALAQPASEIFAQANEAYFDADYTAAIGGYERLIAAGIIDPDVTFNLGTAHAQRGDYGQAIRYFESTISLRAGDEDAEASLEDARRALSERLAAAEGEATLETRPSFGDSLVRPMSENVLAWLVLTFCALFFGALIAVRFVRADAARTALWVGSGVLGALLVLAGVGLLIKSGAFQEGAPAVVVERSPNLYEAPDDRSRVVQTVREGERAAIIDRDGDWVFISLANDREGWTPESAVGEVF